MGCHKQHEWPYGAQWPIFASFGAAAAGTPFSSLKNAKSKHAAVSCHTTRPQKQRSGAVGGAPAPTPTKYSAYCSRCTRMPGSTQCDACRATWAKCGVGRARPSPWPRCASTGTAPGPACPPAVTKYSFACHLGPWGHHHPAHRALAWAALDGGAGRPRAPQSWPQ